MDPYKNLTGAQRVDILVSLGLKWVGGEGENAIWMAPSGERMTERSALLTALGNADNLPGGFKPAPQQASGQQIAPDRTAQIGIDSQGNRRYFTIDRNGFTVWGADAPPDNSQASTGIGYANLAENMRQFDITQQRLAQQAEETAARNRRLDALAEQQQNFLQRKAELAQRNDDTRLANETANQVASIQMQRDRYALEVQQAQQRASEAAQARVDALTRFNAEMGQRVAEANVAAAAQKRRDLADVNEKIGVLGQDTGNRGRWASFVAANKGWGQDAGALTGTSFIDDQSTQPLEKTIGLRNQIQAQQDSPYTFTPVPTTPWAQPVAPTPPAAQPSPAASTQPVLAGLETATPDSAAALMAAVKASDEALKKNIMPPGSAMEHGGMVRGAFMAGDSRDGEENPEVVIPMGDGTMVVSLKGMAPDKVRAIKERMAKFATGGLFDNLTGSPLSREFLQDASRKFREGTPWEGKAGTLPSAVYGSRPGFNPLLNQLLASGRALEQGIPVEYSQYLTNLYRPDAINGVRALSRTA